jgi:hypothetical protein
MNPLCETKQIIKAIKKNYVISFGVFTPVIVMIVVFWILTSCSFLDRYLQQSYCTMKC